jgi:RNA polymerase subunit RPABC4/transcription elongation factor Spt4
MGLKVEYIGGVNPFEWEAFICPVCRSNEFVSHAHAGVYCDCCGAKFSVRTTSGDPGCVVDCIIDPVESVFAPEYTCNGCQAKLGIFDFETKKCPQCASEDLSRNKMMLREWSGIKDFPSAFYLILKTGDYCSGWLPNDHKDHSRLNFPSQEQWEAFQESITEVA